MEYRTGIKCDCCKVFLPSYESTSFDILNEDGSINRTFQGHKKCIEFEYTKFKELQIKN